MRKEIAIVGLGNRMMQDEGIGVRIVEKLAQHDGLPDDVEAIELGVGGFLLLHELEGRQRVLIVDCARMGAEPGTLRGFRPEEARSVKVLPRMSLHEGDVLETLALAESLGQCLPDVRVYGIEPESVEPGRDLTPTLESRLDEYVAQILSDLGSLDRA